MTATAQAAQNPAYRPTPPLEQETRITRCVLRVFLCFAMGLTSPTVAFQHAESQIECGIQKSW